MITAMTDRLLKQMIQFHIIDSEDAEIYRFGLEALLLKLIHYSSYFVIAVFCREWKRFLVFFIAFLLLRKSAGGYHAKTRRGCYIGSCLLVFCIVMCMKMFCPWRNVIVAGGALMVLADSCIFMIAPMENRNRTYDEEESRCFRDRAMKTLVFENIIVALLLVVGKTDNAIPIMLAAIIEAGLLLIEKVRMLKKSK